MARTVSRIITVLFIFTGLSGCEKEKNPFPPGIYLEKVIYHQNVDQINHYYYNNSGFLSSREYEFNDIIAEKFEYQYVNGLVSRIDYYGMNNNTDITLYHKNYLVFNYESDNIIKSSYFPDELVITYEYDSRNRISIINGTSNQTKYEYDNSGNIIKSTVYVDGEEYWKFFYEYDERKNPFQNIDPIQSISGGVDFISYKCPNNVVNQIFINESLDTVSESEFVYTYNDRDYPIESYELFTSESNGYYRDSMHHQLFEYSIK